MKKGFFVLALLLLCLFDVNAQGYHGQVFDEDTQQPMPFVNVMLLQAQDSSLVSGCTTDSLGKFVLPYVAANTILKFSAFGYLTEYKEVAENVLVTMRRNPQIFSEAVVKARRPVYRMTNGMLVSKIEGTVYSQLGDAESVLRQLPLIYESNGQFSVLGRGTPLFYINGRPMHNMEELQEFESDMIKEVRVEMNPGVKYPSGTNAVIHIITNRLPNDGLAGSLTEYAGLTDYFAHHEEANLNYRKGKLDVFLYGSYRFSKKKVDKGENYTFPFQDKIIYQGWDGYEKERSKGLRLSTGFNYVFSQEHSLGVKYSHKREIKNENWLPFENFIQDEVFHSDFYMKGHGFSNTLSFYYTNQFSERWGLAVDATYRNSNSSSNSKETEERLNVDPVEISNVGKSDIYAIKATVTNLFNFGQISWGTEDAYTSLRTVYTMQNDELSAFISNNQNESRQKYISAFLSYQKMFGPIALEAGMRYERTIYDYFKNGIKQEEECKTYGSLLPNLSLSSQMGDLALSLNYNISIERPDYSNLFDGIIYVNSFMYMQGNPMLKNAYDHNVSFMAGYNDLQLMFTYDYIKDYILTTNSLFQLRPVLIHGYQNQNKQQFSAYLVYSPEIAFWTPSLTLGVETQSLNYNAKKYRNRPMMLIDWKNMLALPNKLWFVCNFNWHSSGTRDLFQMKSSWALNCSVIKHWKRWQFQLGVEDIFGTNKTRLTIFEGNIVRKHYALSYDRGVNLAIRYNINSYKSRYKGKTAGQSEIERL